MKDKITEFLDLFTLSELAGICYNLELDIPTGSKKQFISKLTDYYENDLEHLANYVVMKSEQSTIERISKKLGIADSVDDLVNRAIVLGKFLDKENNTELISNHQMDDVYKLLDNYFLYQVDRTIRTQFEKHGKEVYINKEIFLLENHIHNLKKTNRINLLLNPNMLSDSILSSINRNINPHDYLRESDYQISVLNFLAQRLQSNKKPTLLINIIDEYFNQKNVLDCLRILDLKIHLTGGTRCKSYFQNSINQLRKLGLIFIPKDSPKEKSSYQDENIIDYYPTYFGLVILTYLNKNRKIIEDRWSYVFAKKEINFLTTPYDTKISGSVNPIIEFVFEELDDPTNLHTFFEDEFNYLDYDEIILAKDILRSYRQILSSNMDIERDDNNQINKITINKEFYSATNELFAELQVNSKYKLLFKKILYNNQMISEITYDLFHDINNGKINPFG